MEKERFIPLMKKAILRQASPVALAG